MSTSHQDKILKNSLWATLINSSVAVIFRAITFILNAFILRRISAHILGVINVRLLLLVDTILFISREAFRRACLKKPENGDWKGTINLLWMSVPLGIIWSFIWGLFWIYQLELPEEQEQIQYRYSVILICLRNSWSLRQEIKILLFILTAKNFLSCHYPKFGKKYGIIEENFL